jgi:hypothetical protein
MLLHGRSETTAWRQVAPPSDYVIASERGGRMRPLSIVVWFNRAFRNVGLKGCSSHSGRRTFVTRAARIVHKAGGSLRDVQLSSWPTTASQRPVVDNKTARIRALNDELRQNFAGGIAVMTPGHRRARRRSRRPRRQDRRSVR